MTGIRLAILATILALAAGSYLLLLLGSPNVDMPQERTHGTLGDAEHGVHVYLEVISVDAIRDAMQVRVSVEQAGLGTDTQSMPLDRDLVLVLVHDKRGERVALQAHQSLPTTTVELDLYGGDITSYPLDAYRAGLWVRCFEAAAQTEMQPNLLPIHVTIWERFLGFRVQTNEELASVPGEKRLTFDIRRTVAFMFFALATYSAMAMLACGALTIGMLAFLRVRRAEPTLISASGALVFALPALRNALPGGAPLGVCGDIFVFLWAELAAVLAFVLLVATWARVGPRP
ncbi:MAG: DUF4436 family protein [Rhodopila sp.]|jgi:hypothetical protein